VASQDFAICGNGDANGVAYRFARRAFSFELSATSCASMKARHASRFAACGASHVPDGSM
jgi:hypothetical protein